MSRQIIHFAPANSFPARSYDKLFRFLDDEFEVNYLHLHAHNPRFPVSNGWRFLVEELINEIENRYSAPIIGVGHSLGGILQFMAAAEKPELFRAIILLDAPLVSRLSGAGVKLLKRLNLMHRFSPSKVAVKRRREWNSKSEAVEHFERKFRSFDKEMVADYVEHGTIENERGTVELLFKPEIEAAIYRNLPDDFSRFIGKLKVPGGYIGGTNSVEARLARLGFMRKNFEFQFQFVEGSHHFPFQKPQAAAIAIREMIRRLNVE